MEEKHRGKLYQATVSVCEREKLQAQPKAAEDAINVRAVALSDNIPWGKREWKWETR